MQTADIIETYLLTRYDTQFDRLSFTQARLRLDKFPRSDKTATVEVKDSQDASKVVYLVRRVPTRAKAPFAYELRLALSDRFERARLIFSWIPGSRVVRVADYYRTFLRVPSSVASKPSDLPDADVFALELTDDDDDDLDREDGGEDEMETLERRVANIEMAARDETRIAARPRAARVKQVPRQNPASGGSTQSSNDSDKDEESDEEISSDDGLGETEQKKKTKKRSRDDDQDASPPKRQKVLESVASIANIPLPVFPTPVAPTSAFQDTGSSSGSKNSKKRVTPTLISKPAAPPVQEAETDKEAPTKPTNMFEATSAITSSIAAGSLPRLDIDNLISMFARAFPTTLSLSEEQAAEAGFYQRKQKATRGEEGGAGNFEAPAVAPISLTELSKDKINSAVADVLKAENYKTLPFFVVNNAIKVENATQEAPAVKYNLSENDVIGEFFNVLYGGNPKRVQAISVEYTKTLGVRQFNGETIATVKAPIYVAYAFPVDWELFCYRIDEKTEVSTKPIFTSSTGARKGFDVKAGDVVFVPPCIGAKAKMVKDYTGPVPQRLFYLPQKTTGISVPDNTKDSSKRSLLVQLNRIFNESAATATATVPVSDAAVNAANSAMKKPENVGKVVRFVENADTSSETSSSRDDKPKKKKKKTPSRPPEKADKQEEAAANTQSKKPKPDARTIANAASSSSSAIAPTSYMNEGVFDDPF